MQSAVAVFVLVHYYLLCTLARLPLVRPTFNKINKQFRHVSGILWITKNQFDAFFLLCAHSVPHTNKCHMKRTVAEHTATHVHFNEIFTQELRLIDFQIDTRTLHLFCASLPFIFHIYSMFGSVQQFAVIFSCHFVIRKSWQSYSFNWHQLYWPYWINMEYRSYSSALHQWLWAHWQTIA